MIVILNILKVSKKGYNMVNVKNLDESNSNIKVLEDSEYWGYKIIEYVSDLSVTPGEAIYKYFASKMNCRQRQVLINMQQGYDWTLSAGAMLWMTESIQAKTNIKGVGDMIGKFAKASVTKETMVKPVYSGEGTLALEPTWKHIIPIETSQWGNAVVMNDGYYLASTGLDITVKAPDSVSGALLAGEGYYNTFVKGDGLVLLESSVPVGELVCFEVKDDVVKIDGNLAICWSSGLRLTVERVTKTLIGSAASGEGLVNVYRGTGKIFMQATRDAASSVYKLK